MSRPRTKSAEDRRKDLLDTGLRLFLAKGVGLTSVEDITAAAGVAKGTFYLHFPSKEALLSALETRFAQAQLARLKAALARSPTQDWGAALEAWVDAAVEAFSVDAKVHDLIFYGFRPASREDLSTNAVTLSLSGLLTGGCAAGAWSLPDCWQTAVFLYAGLHEAVAAALLSKKTRLPRLKRDIHSIFMGVLGIRGSSAQ